TRLPAGMRRTPGKAGTSSMSASQASASAVLDLEREPRQALQDRAVELVLVGFGRLLVEGRREVVAQIGEQLGPGLHDVDVIAVLFLRIVARRVVVGALGLLTLADQVGFLADEEIELPRDHVGEAAAPKHAPTLAALWRSSFVPGTSFTATRSRLSGAHISRRWCDSP